MFIHGKLVYTKEWDNPNSWKLIHDNCQRRRRRSDKGYHRKVGNYKRKN